MQTNILTLTDPFNINDVPSARKWFARGLVKIFSAVARLFCLTLSGSCSVESAHHVRASNGEIRFYSGRKYRVEQKTLLSSVTQFPSGLMGCALAA